jgi:hypothetical protein
MLESTRVAKLNAAADRIGGYQGALAFLAGLPDEISRKVLLPAMKAADLVGKNAAEAEARRHTSDRPKKGGHLVTTTGAAEARLNSTVVGKVGFFGKAGAHGWLVEHGHRMVVGGTVARVNKASRQFGRSPKAKSAANTGAGRVVGQVPEHPILLPAYEKAKAGMEQAFAGEVIARTDKVATQLAKQTGAI